MKRIVRLDELFQVSIHSHPAFVHTDPKLAIVPFNCTKAKPNHSAEEKVIT